MRLSYEYVWYAKIYDNMFAYHEEKQQIAYHEEKQQIAHMIS